MNYNLLLFGCLGNLTVCYHFIINCLFAQIHHNTTALSHVIIKVCVI